MLILKLSKLFPGFVLTMAIFFTTTYNVDEVEIHSYANRILVLFGFTVSIQSFFS